MRAADDRRAAVRPGLTLLEVLVALAILGLTAAAWAGLSGQAMQAVRTVTSRELEITQASQVLARISVWPADKLANSVGTSPSDRFVISIAEIAPALYEVAVADSARRRILLRTTLYRRGPGAPAR